MKNLTKAVIAVMKAVKGIEKNSSIGYGRNAYKGVSDKDVKEVYSKAMAANGLCILPIDIEENTTVERWKEGDKTKQSVFCRVKTKYLLCHTSGETQEISGIGHGVDSQDKAAGKATTYAMKYALLYTFMTPTGDIDDADETHSEEIKTPKKETPKPKAKKAPKKKPALEPGKYQGAAEAIAKGDTSFEDIREIRTLSAAAEKTIQGLIDKLKE
jgi:hypothetical protein